MEKYLISGPSGSGKSAIAQELQYRGLHAVDADKDGQLSWWRNRRTGNEASYLPPGTDEWFRDHGWLWNRRRMHEILASHAGYDALFLCGGAHNEEEFYDLFDRIVFLKADEQTIRQRLESPERINAMGKHPVEVERIVSNIREIEKLAPLIGAILIDATPPIAEVADAVLLHTYHDDRNTFTSGR